MSSEYLFLFTLLVVPSVWLRIGFVAYWFYQQYRPKQHDEEQYLALMRLILHHGVDKGDRTGTGTRSIFGHTMRFCLTGNTIPALTTKSVHWKSVVEELLWMLRGETDARILNAKGVKIWNQDASLATLRKRGFTQREEGDLGPIYGFQWRHWGASYKTAKDNYHQQGIDQFAQVIHTLRHNPNDRRIIMSAWNVGDISSMALPPCHVLCQFYADPTAKTLSCSLYQRSADVALGVPFNIASYGLLTHIVAKLTGYKAKELIYTTGDTHLYRNHFDGATKQVQRFPSSSFPTVKLPSWLQELEDVNRLRGEDVVLRDYHPQPSIPYPLST